MEVALLYDPIHNNIINYETLEYPKTKICHFSTLHETPGAKDPTGPPTKATRSNRGPPHPPGDAICHMGLS